MTNRTLSCIHTTAALWLYLKNGMLCHPTATVADSEGWQTVEEMLTAVEILAERLHDAGCVAILCRTGRRRLTALLACLKASVTALPLTGRLAAQGLPRGAAPTCVLTEENGVLTVLPYTVAAEEPVRSRSIAASPAILLPLPQTGPLSLTPDGLTTAMEAVWRTGLNGNDRLLVRSFGEGLLPLGEMLVALRCGASLFLLPDDPHPQTVLRQLERHRITAMSAPPSLLFQLLRFCRVSLPSLVRVTVEGCPPPSVMAQLVESLPGVAVGCLT